MAKPGSPSQVDVETGREIPSGRSGLNLVLIGPPGAGKGSLAARLGSLGLEHVSSGDLFRAEAARGTADGDVFAAALKKGRLIPDGPTLALMRKWYFARKGARGFLLDGFPRNLLQARALGDWMETRRETLTMCVYLNLTRDEAVRRISQRRVCPVDGEVYHLAAHPPAVSGKCDRCGGALIQRTDDEEETVVKRWKLFEEQTFPVVDYYRQQGILLSLDASRSAADLQADVLAALVPAN